MQTPAGATHVFRTQTAPPSYGKVVDGVMYAFSQKHGWQPALFPRFYKPL